MAWLLIVAALGMDSGTSEALPAGTAQKSVTDNFQVHCASPKLDARHIAKECELWRTKLFATWRPEDPLTAWQVRCQVVVHGTRQSYVVAVGSGGKTSLGSSLIDFQGDIVSQHRIDLLPNEDGELSALGHEMTHIVVAGCFGGKQLPRWADEGMAILADSFHKQRLHQRDLEVGLARQQAFSCVELLTIGDYPPMARIPAFYGQSASVVAFFCHRDKPARFVEFVKLAMQKGNAAAMQEIYGMGGMHELERLWRRDLVAAVNFHGVRVALAN